MIRRRRQCLKPLTSRLNGLVQLILQDFLGRQNGQILRHMNPAAV
jgi:hypothetical protein